MHEIHTVIDKVHTYNKKNDTSEFPVLPATEYKMQTDTCTVEEFMLKNLPRIVLFSLHTPPELLPQPM